MEVVIYGWDEADFRCVPCLKAKRMSEVKGIEYTFKPVVKNIEPTPEHVKNRSEVEMLMKHNGKELKSFPQVFAYTDVKTLHHIGGFDDYKQFIHNVIQSSWNS